MEDTLEKNDTALRWRTVVLLSVVLALFYWLGTGRVSLFDRDEPRFAEPAKEMLFSTQWQDWIVPHMNGEVHFHKPPFAYWQMAGAFKIFGVSEFAARFFSGFWTALTAGVLGAYLSKRFSALVGIGGALAFGTSLLTVVEAKLCLADATLGFFTLICVLAIWDIYRGEKSVKVQMALWFSAGIAILVKGPVVFILLIGNFTTMIILDLFARRYNGEERTRWIRGSGLWWGIPLSLAIGLPWYILANHLSGGALVDRFVGYDLLRRVAKPAEGHSGFPGYYLVTGLIDTWPWSGFLVPVAVYAWRQRWNRDVRFLLSWLIGPTLFFEVMATKIIHYWLIILPAYSILFAMMMDDVVFGAGESLWRRYRKPVSFVIGGMWFALGVVSLWASHRYIGLKAEMIVFAAILFFSAVLLFYLSRTDDAISHFWGVTWTSVLIVATISVFVLPLFEPYKIGKLVADAMKREGGPDSRYALIRWKEESTLYYLNSGKGHVQLGGAEDFMRFYHQPKTVIGVEDKAIDDVMKKMPADLRSHIEFYTVKGYDFTRGFKEKTIYIAKSKS